MKEHKGRDDDRSMKMYTFSFRGIYYVAGMGEKEGNVLYIVSKVADVTFTPAFACCLVVSLKKKPYASQTIL